VRQGWWALPGTAPTVLDACRAGGRLACVSALEHHGLMHETNGRLHIELPRSSPGPRTRHVVAHWTRKPAGGDRQAVDPSAAWRQARRCGDATGTLEP
jgi:hypothetical protein